MTPTLTPGIMLQNRYRIVQPLGQGGMGAVYRAYDTRLNIEVAIKEMIPQPGLDPQTLAGFRQQFHQEAQVLALLDHPNLVRVTDYFEESGNAYLVMNFVVGENLNDVIARRGALPEPEVLAIAAQLLDALAYCHRKGVIHRDIKPQNIIIRRDGRPVLVDFGLVKLWDPNSPYTKTVVRGFGTPGYAPLEQYGRGSTDPRSDLYSLGATLYHALTGRVPLGVTDRVAFPHQFPSPRSVNPRISVRTEEAILRAMAIQPEARFRSAAEMAQALGVTTTPMASSLPSAAIPAISEKTGTVVLPTSPKASSADVLPAQWSFPAWIIWTAVGAALFVFITTIIGLFAVGLRLFTPPSSTPTAITPFPTPMPSSSPQPQTPSPTSTPVPPDLVGTPIPQSLTTISPQNAGQVTQLARWGKGTVNMVKYSPDGRFLAVASSLGIYLYDAQTLEEVRFIEYPVWVISLAFSPDGTLLASGSSDNIICLWSVPDGALILGMKGHTGIVYSLAFSPDAQTLASGSEDQTIRLWRVADGALLRTLDGPGSPVRSVAFSPDGALLASGLLDKTIRPGWLTKLTFLGSLRGYPHKSRSSVVGDVRHAAVKQWPVPGQRPGPVGTQARWASDGGIADAATANRFAGNSSRDPSVYPPTGEP